MDDDKTAQKALCWHNWKNFARASECRVQGADIVGDRKGKGKRGKVGKAAVETSQHRQADASIVLVARPRPRPRPGHLAHSRRVKT